MNKIKNICCVVFGFLGLLTKAIISLKRQEKFNTSKEILQLKRFYIVWALNLF